MQYQVPQFIEIEDKILSFVTVKQFVYLFIVALFIMLLYFILQFTLWVVLAVLIGGIAVGLTFIEYNGRPLSALIVSVFFYFWRPRQYVWKRKEELEALRAREAEKMDSPIQSLWLKLTTGTTAIPKREQALPKHFFGGGQSRFQIIHKIAGDQEVARRIDYR